MRTTADAALDAADSQVRDAVRQLSLVIERCSGYDEYNVMYWKEIKQCLQSLIEVSSKLNR